MTADTGYRLQLLLDCSDQTDRAEACRETVGQCKSSQTDADKQMDRKTDGEIERERKTGGGTPGMTEIWQGKLTDISYY